MQHQSCPTHRHTHCDHPQRHHRCFSRSHHGDVDADATVDVVCVASQAQDTVRHKHHHSRPLVHEDTSSCEHMILATPSHHQHRRRHHPLHVHHLETQQRLCDWCAHCVSIARARRSHVHDAEQPHTCCDMPIASSYRCVACDSDTPLHLSPLSSFVRACHEFANCNSNNTQSPLVLQAKDASTNNTIQCFKNSVIHASHSFPRSLLPATACWLTPRQKLRQKFNCVRRDDACCCNAQNNVLFIGIICICHLQICRAGYKAVRSLAFFRFQNWQKLT